VIRRNRVPLWTVAALLLTAPTTAATPPTKPAPDETPKTVARLIADLDSGKYAVRRQASRQLLEMGQPVVAPLAKAAKQGSLEVAVRALAVLEVYFRSENEVVSEEAESALERLAASKNHAVARRAESVLNSHPNQELREQRALAAILKLGGITKPLPGMRGRGPSYYLQIGATWKGGDAGLKYVKRLRRLQHLYRIDDNGVSEKAWEDLATAMPQLLIHRRGPAFLGIKGAVDPFGRIGCPVAEVTAGSAAEKGGISRGDVIAKFGGKKVANFDMLIELIKEKKAGDKVAVEVLRGGKPVTLEVVLSGWK